MAQAPTMPVDQTVIDQFAQQLRGTLIDRNSSGYDDARRVYNAMIDRRPLMIARCADVADVIACVNFAREHHLLVAIRGGGHNGPGLGVCDDGLVIDLSMMDGIRVDPEAKTVRVEGGALLGAVDHATHAFGLAIPSGIISTTGVGGLTLGGGIGHLTRKAGLAIDHLLEADVVLADGSLVVANADQHSDLFWAIRGGGGNFGVVVSFLFGLEPISMLYAGPMLWTLDKATDVLSWYRDFLPAAPDDLNGFFAFLSVPPGPPFPEELHNKTMCGVVWAYAGPMDQAEAVFAPIRQQFGPPALDWVGPIPQPALQSMFDPIYPPGLQWYWKADFFNEITDEAVAQHVAHGSSLPTGFCTMHLYPVDGAASRVPADATPWAYRDAKWAGVIVGVSPDPADKDVITKWARDYWNAIHPYSAGGAYINFMMEEGADRVRATYGANYDRLASIKKTYDPTNLFQVNQNIKPV
jgi:FAD/FMN-containing dehydrogenase